MHTAYMHTAFCTRDTRAQTYANMGAGKTIDLSRVSIKSAFGRGSTLAKEKDKDKPVFALVHMNGRSWTFEAASAQECEQWCVVWHCVMSMRCDVDGTVMSMAL